MRDGDYKMLALQTPQADPGKNSDAKPPKGMSIMQFIKQSNLSGFTMYNLTKDPSETRDLAATEPERFAEMREKMIKLHREIQKEGPSYDLGGKKKQPKKK